MAIQGGGCADGELGAAVGWEVTSLDPGEQGSCQTSMANRDSLCHPSDKPMKQGS